MFCCQSCCAFGDNIQQYSLQLALHTSSCGSLQPANLCAAVSSSTLHSSTMLHPAAHNCITPAAAAFGAQVNEYLASQGKETHTAAVIQSNPEQSKHLETARMKVNSMWIDLVNLRSETYADGSRIPKMEFGTPFQDAMRRYVWQCIRWLHQEQ